MRAHFFAALVLLTLSSCSTNNGDTDNTVSAGGDSHTSAGGDSHTSAGGDSHTSAGGDSTGTFPLAVPSEGALLGAFTGKTSIAAFESMIGRKLAIRHSFHDWDGDFVAEARLDIQADRIPLITWQPLQRSVGISLDEIIRGDHDDLIRSRALAAKQTKRAIMLRWGHEMNGDWFSWGGVQNGASAQATQKYVEAYKHIHDIFSSSEAHNVVWVFCPNANSIPDKPWNHWSAYYPGDNYVDWIGIDGYNWGTTQDYGSKWQSFQEIVAPVYSEMAQKGKHILIVETASTEKGGRKSEWIASIIPTLRKSFPAIKAVTWFNGTDVDWAIDTSADSLAAFGAMAQDAYFDVAASAATNASN